MEKIKVDNLQAGMLVDCEHDPMNEYEYSLVMETEKENLSCICVYFDFGAVGYAPSDEVRVQV